MDVASFIISKLQYNGGWYIANVSYASFGHFPYLDKNNVAHLLNDVSVKGYTNTYTFINAKLKL